MWSQGGQVVFYPSNLGLTTAGIKNHKKDQKSPRVPLITASRKAYLKNDKKLRAAKPAPIFPYFPLFLPFLIHHFPAKLSGVTNKSDDVTSRTKVLT